MKQQTLELSYLYAGLALAAALIIGGFIGYSFAPKMAGPPGRAGGEFGQGAGRAARGGGGGLVTGTVASMSEGSMTVNVSNRQGESQGSKIIFITPETQVGKFMQGTSTDLSSGTNVMITGTTNSDGSVTATNVQIRPEGMPGFGGPKKAN